MPGKPARYRESGNLLKMNMEERVRKWLEDRLENLEPVEKDLKKHVRTIVGIFRLSRQDLVQDIKEEPQYPLEVRMCMDDQSSLDDLRKSVLVFELRKLTCLNKEAAELVVEDLFKAYNLMMTDFELKQSENGNALQNHSVCQPATRSEPVSRSEQETSYASAFPALPPKGNKPKLQSEPVSGFWQQRSPLRSNLSVQSSKNKIIMQNSSSEKAPSSIKKNRRDGKENECHHTCLESKKKMNKNRDLRNRRDSSSSIQQSPKTAEENQYLAFARTALLQCLGVDERKPSKQVSALPCEENVDTESPALQMAETKVEWPLLDADLQATSSCWNPAHVTEHPWWDSLPYMPDTILDTSQKNQRSASEPHLVKQESVVATESPENRMWTRPESMKSSPSQLLDAHFPRFPYPCATGSESPEKLPHDDLTSPNLRKCYLAALFDLDHCLSQLQAADQIGASTVGHSNSYQDTCAHSTCTTIFDNHGLTTLGSQLGSTIWSIDHVSTAEWPKPVADIPTTADLQLDPAASLNQMQKPLEGGSPSLPLSTVQFDGCIYQYSKQFEEDHILAHEKEYLNSKFMSHAHELDHQILQGQVHLPSQFLSGDENHLLKKEVTEDCLNSLSDGGGCCSEVEYQKKQLQDMAYLHPPEIYSFEKMLDLRQCPASEVSLFKEQLELTKDLALQAASNDHNEGISWYSNLHHVVTEWKKPQIAWDCAADTTVDQERQQPNSQCTPPLTYSHNKDQEFQQYNVFTTGATLHELFRDMFSPPTSSNSCKHFQQDSWHACSCGQHSKHIQCDSSLHCSFYDQNQNIQPHFSLGPQHMHFIENSCSIRPKTEPSQTEVTPSTSTGQNCSFHILENQQYDPFSRHSSTFPVPQLHHWSSNDHHVKNQDDEDRLGLRRLASSLQRSHQRKWTGSLFEWLSPSLENEERYSQDFSGQGLSIPKASESACDVSPHLGNSKVFCCCGGACNCSSRQPENGSVPVQLEDVSYICDSPKSLRASYSSMQVSRNVIKSASDSNLYCVPSERSAFRKVSSTSYPTLVWPNMPKELAHQFSAVLRPRTYQTCLVENASDYQLENLQRNRLRVIKPEEPESGSDFLPVLDVSILSHPDVFGEWPSKQENVPDFLMKKSKETQTSDDMVSCGTSMSPALPRKSPKQVYEEKQWKDLCPLTEEDIQREHLHAMIQAHQQGTILDVAALEEYDQFADFQLLSESSASLHIPQNQAVYVKDLEKAWLSESHRRLGKKVRRPLHPNKPCSFYLEGCCYRSDCKFSHDISTITCHFWEEGLCFKGDLCPFLHGYSGGQYGSDEAEEFDVTKEDFPELTRQEVRLNSAPASKKRKSKKNSVHRLQLPRGT